MKVVKAFFAVIFSLVILLSCTWLTSASAISHVLQRKVLEPVLDSLDLESLIGSVLSDGMTGMDDLTRSLMTTDAVTDFAADFAGEYLDALVFDDPEPVLTGDTLAPVIGEAISELQNAGNLSAEDALILAGMQFAIPQLAEEIASYAAAAIPSKDALLSQLGVPEDLLQDLLYLIGPQVRNILLGFTIVSALIILLLYLKRGGGLIWNGILFSLIGIICVIGGIVLRCILIAPLAAYHLSALANTVQNAFLTRGGIVCGIGLLLLLIGIIWHSVTPKKAAPAPRHGA